MTLLYDDDICSAIADQYLPSKWDNAVNLAFVAITKEMVAYMKYLKKKKPVIISKTKPNLRDVCTYMELADWRIDECTYVSLHVCVLLIIGRLELLFHFIISNSLD